MARVPPGEWVPHVEAYVDVSRPAAQHSASVDTLAALVSKDKLTLFDLVSKMEMYLTTTDHIVRSRGILLLAEILSRISVKWLDVNTITTLSDFFISRLIGKQYGEHLLVAWHYCTENKVLVPSCLLMSKDLLSLSYRMFKCSHLQLLTASCASKF